MNGNDNLMDLQVYTEFTRTTRSEMKDKIGKDPTILELCLGLAGEVGEICDKIKRPVREGESPLKLDKDTLKLEIGDVFWYLTSLADEYNISLAEVVTANIQKISSRIERGTLYGEGDSR